MSNTSLQVDPSLLRLIPDHIGRGFCVYGELSEEVRDWVSQNKFKCQPSGRYTNILIPEKFSVEDILSLPDKFEYMDGFSPNLNKHLHIGHLSNLILAKAYQSLGVSKRTVALLGDTLTGAVEHEEALSAYKIYCTKYKYHLDRIYFASQMQLSDKNLLHDGEGEYEGTKVFNIPNEQPIVGIKSNGATSYFYQDVAFASELNAKTLYLTGSEQDPHFKSLQRLFPHIQHIPLGLVFLNGDRQRTRSGTSYSAKEVFDGLEKEFEDPYLAYNVLAGQILKSEASAEKNIISSQFKNHKTSGGLYISYTLARLKSAGISTEVPEKFSSFKLGFSYVKSRSSLSPHILFGALLEFCQYANSMYSKERIVGNESVTRYFTDMANDIELGLKRLGMFTVSRV